MLDDHLGKEQALLDKKILFYLVALVNPWFWSKIGNYPFVFGQNEPWNNAWWSLR